jgi:hypothetical protein
MAFTDQERVRRLLGESIPEGGSESDTLFTDAEIDDFLLLGGNNLERATYEGWRAKAARLSDLVNITEGNASRAMSDAHKHALDMVKQFARSAGGPTEGRTRIGKIRRS